MEDKRKGGYAFDLEGTLVDVERAHHRAHVQIARECGLRLRGYKDAAMKLPHFIGGPERTIYEEIVALSGRTDLDIDVLLARKALLYEQNLARMKIRLRPGARKFILQALADGRRVSVASLTPRAQALTLLERSGLLDLIPREMIVMREDVEKGKPAPDCHIEACRRMDLPPELVVAFEDSPNGIRAAKAAGIPFIVAMPVYRFDTVLRALFDAGATDTFDHWDRATFDAAWNIGFGSGH